MNLRQNLTRESWADFPTRVITTLIGVPLVILVIVFGSPAFDILIFGLASIAIYEMNHVLRSRERSDQIITFVAAFSVIVFVAYLPGYVLLLPLILAFIFALGVSNWTINTLYKLGGILYIGLPLALLLTIRHMPDGLLWIMTLTWTVWVTDTFALVGGRLFGHHKLAPAISPAKTIEGALVGILFGIGTGFAILVIAGHPVAMAMSLSAAASGMAVLGDLFESLIKRHFRVKDSSNILPGHGGIMDRIDSILGATPVFFLILLAFTML